MRIVTSSPRHRRLLVTCVLVGLFVVAVAAVLALLPHPAAYVPGEHVAGLTSSLAKNLPADYSGVQLVDVTDRSGIKFNHFQGVRSSQLPEDMGSGAAWGDYDHDGYPDLFLPNEAGPITMTTAQVAASPARCALYHNNGDGTFTDVTDAAGLGNLRGWFMGAVWADFDNDGRLDLFITAYGENKLLKGDGKGHFTDVTTKAGLAGRKGFWTGAAWGDYDRDGHLDLYVCGYVKYAPLKAGEKAAMSKQYDTDISSTLNPSAYPAEENLLYHNRGDGTFEEVAHKLSVDDPAGRSLCAVWCDFDGDGWPDLYVNNDVSMHAFYQNTGNGRFKDIGTTSWACDYRGGMGITIGDWDNNGKMDFFLTHWLAQENALYHYYPTPTKPGPGGQPGARAASMSSSVPAGAKRPEIGLSSGKGQMHFADISDQVGLGQSSLDYVKWGCSFVDLDNDGRLDLAVVSGSTVEEQGDQTKLVAMPNLIYWNGCTKSGYLENGSSDRGFFEVTPVASPAMQALNVARGLATADFDRDGARDLIITRMGGPALLLRNQGGKHGGFLGVELEGTGRCNRSAIGAKLTLHAGGLLQVRQVVAGSSYLSQDELVQHFGLGAASKVDSLEVWWPDGRTQTFKDLPANQYLRIMEGSAPVPMVLKKGGKP